MAIQIFAGSFVYKVPDNAHDKAWVEGRAPPRPRIPSPLAPRPSSRLTTPD